MPLRTDFVGTYFRRSCQSTGAVDDPSLMIEAYNSLRKVACAPCEELARREAKSQQEAKKNTIKMRVVSEDLIKCKKILKIYEQ